MNALDKFQNEASFQRPKDARTIEFQTMRLTEEAGEVAGLVKRASARLMGKPMNGKRSLTRTERERVADELADVFHTVSKLATEAGISLSDIAEYALLKQAGGKGYRGFKWSNYTRPNLAGNTRVLLRKGK